MARPRRGVTAADRAFSSIDFGLCWEWTGYRQPDGAGRFRVGGRKVLAHKWIWEHLVGPVPDGLELDHLCRNPPCCNPDHLEPVTHRINVLRGNAPAARHARKTHCPRGHTYDATNTRLYRGKRYCRACRRQPTQSGRDGGYGCPGPNSTSRVLPGPGSASTAVAGVLPTTH